MLYIGLLVSVLKTMEFNLAHLSIQYALYDQYQKIINYFVPEVQNEFYAGGTYIVL